MSDGCAAGSYSRYPQALTTTLLSFITIYLIKGRTAFHEKRNFLMHFLAAAYPWIKAAHIVSVIAWMAAIFYLPRLFAYHAGTGGTESASHEVFTVMEGRLLRIIATPAMALTWLFGLMLLMIPGTADWSDFWPWIKAVSVLAMSGFHFWLAGKRRELLAGTCNVTERRFRLMNEAPTVLMVVIIVMVIVRPF